MIYRQRVAMGALRRTYYSHGRTTYPPSHTVGSVDVYTSTNLMLETNDVFAAISVRNMPRHSFSITVVGNVLFSCASPFVGYQDASLLPRKDYVARRVYTTSRDEGDAMDEPHLSLVEEEEGDVMDATGLEDGVSNETAGYTPDSRVVSGGHNVEEHGTTLLSSLGERPNSDDDHGSDHRNTTEDSHVPRVTFHPCDAPPSRFETFSGTKVFQWVTTAKYGRRLIGPMREWADELKYRTGITVQWEPVAPDRVVLREYKHRDDVDVNVYIFGSERAVENAMGLLQEMVQQEPSYVRCAVYRGHGSDVQWLSLRRMNNDTRPPDIPPISLKTPGKWTLLFETRKEAILRTVFEETGIHLEETALTYTGIRNEGDVEYFWRVPVHYYVAALPQDATVLGPQTARNDYFTSWDAKILLQSPDPIDRAWATTADPNTGCAWLSTTKIDELQLPIRGEDYMRSRYLPAPHLQELRKTLGWA